MTARRNAFLPASLLACAAMTAHADAPRTFSERAIGNEFVGPIDLKSCG
jgi:hypothetical protein